MPTLRLRPSTKYALSAETQEFGRRSKRRKQDTAKQHRIRMSRLDIG
ncbi:MAG: hypothetical protein WKF71_18045 [Pyrinomonadaceae bacterium]